MSFLSARLNAGLSQTAVARELGISTASISQWENGKTLPRTEKLKEIAALYNCTVDELLTSETPES